MAEPVVTIFRSRVRPEAAQEYGRWAERMLRLAEQMPGFRSIRSYSAPDGERVSIIEFDSASAALAWQQHPEHREAQRLGREQFYAEFDVTVCTPLRRYRFTR